MLNYSVLVQIQIRISLIFINHVITLNNSSSNRMFDSNSERWSKTTGLIFSISLITLSFIFFSFLLSYIDSIFNSMGDMSSADDAYKIFNNESSKYTKEYLKTVQIGQYFDNGIRPDDDRYWMVDPIRNSQFMFNLYKFYWRGMRDLSINILEFTWGNRQYWDIADLIDNEYVEIIWCNFNKMDNFYSDMFYSNFNGIYKNTKLLIDELINFDTFWLDFSGVTVYWTTEIQFKHWAPAMFIASGNFQYQDYWWCHIAVYYYWLWFFFIFLIVFFFITFMWEVEYNMMKNNPQRETRGVSRSKCGDLITSVVPISWATAIIIHESTDAIDHTDGFGTLDFVVGVRAFQWGWEYYYPNTLKINYELSNDRYIQLGKSYLDISNNYEYSVNKNLKNLIINKKKNFNILPIFLITNNDLNKEFFNINKFNNFGYSKLCLFNAYKFSLKNKAINYNNILTSNSNLTNFNSKKFLSKYVSNESLNQTQTSIITNKELKLFKKNYNTYDIDLYLKKNRYELLNKQLNNLYVLNFNNFINLPKINLWNFKNIQDFLFLNFNIKINAVDYNINNNYMYSNWNINFKPINGFYSQMSSFFLFNDFYNFKNINLSLISDKLLNYRRKLTFFEFYKKKLNFNLYNFNFFFNNLYADIDSKRLSNNELMEDLYWNFYIDDSNLFNSDVSCDDSFNKNEFNFVIWGRYEWDLGNLYKHNLTSKLWYLLSDSQNKNFINNLYINYNNNYKNIFIFNKILSTYDVSFINYKNLNTLLYGKNLNFINYDNVFFNILDVSNVFIKNLKFYNNMSTIYSNNNFLFKYSNLSQKYNTNLVLHEPIKNINVINGSIWKVFKFSIYDNRWHFNKVSNSFINNKIPFFNKTSFNNYTIVNKNVNFFYKSLNFNKVFIKYNNIYKTKLFNNINLVTFELPFDLSSECDLFKYNWIDWYNFYSRKEIKYQDVKEYNLNGSKLFYNKYDYNFKSLNDLNILENYFNRLLSNRKNYTDINNRTPILLLKNSNFSEFINLQNSLKEIYFNDYVEEFVYNKTFVAQQNILLNYWSSFDKSLILSNYSNNFINSISDSFSPNKNYLSTLGMYNNYYNIVSHLNSILLKRSNLYKQIFNYNSLNYSKFSSYNNTLINDILLDWKSSLFNNSNSNILLEVNHSLLHFDYYFYAWNPIFFCVPERYIDADEFFNKLDRCLDFKVNKKTQYNQMKKSISNMLRIQNDKSVCMPTDTRIQILTWSKDIIHSWAIPSAGIKIDCIPGYSSHKVFNLTLSGIYYGQCMEICGRFHHWMPIVVYFLRRDLFLFWCTTFLNNKKTDSNNINKKLLNKNNNLFY